MTRWMGFAAALLAFAAPALAGATATDLDPRAKPAVQERMAASIADPGTVVLLAAGALGLVAAAHRRRGDRRS